MAINQNVQFYYGVAKPENNIIDGALYFIPNDGLYRGIENDEKVKSLELIANATDMEAINSAINNAIAGLGQVVRYIGQVKDDDVSVEDGKKAENVTLKDATDSIKIEPGNVVLKGNKEFIANSDGNWEEFGDLTGYILKTEADDTYAKKEDLTDGKLTVKEAEHAATAGSATNAENAGHAITADSAINAKKIVGEDSAALTVGEATKPVYFKDGVPVEINHTIESSVPANAVFTDTVTTIASTITGSGNAITSITANEGVLTLDKGTTFATETQYNALSGLLTWQNI